jgi:NADH:ubiquinone oxidoreductase subunit 6 (subunit J)
MLTRRVMDDQAKVMNNQVILSLIVAVAVLFVFLKVLCNSDFQTNNHAPSINLTSSSAAQPTEGTDSAAPNASYQNDVVSLGSALLKPQNGFAFAFEFVSILLLSALVGAVVVARKDPA